MFWPAFSHRHGCSTRAGRWQPDATQDNLEKFLGFRAIWRQARRPAIWCGTAATTGIRRPGAAATTAQLGWRGGSNHARSGANGGHDAIWGEDLLIPELENSIKGPARVPFFILPICQFEICC